ncbi:hypothetical protein ACMAZF_10345 [Psychrobium sp. nBUS_13]
MSLDTIDVVVFIAYVIGLIAVAMFVSREKEGHEKGANDYFLA